MGKIYHLGLSRSSGQPMEGLEEVGMVKMETDMVGSGHIDLENFLQDIVQGVLLFGPEV